MVEYTYQDEHRGLPLAGTPAVALFGDSFTSGDEVVALIGIAMPRRSNEALPPVRP